MDLKRIDLAPLKAISFDLACVNIGDLDLDTGREFLVTSHAKKLVTSTSQVKTVTSRDLATPFLGPQLRDMTIFTKAPL